MGPVCRCVSADICARVCAYVRGVSPRAVVLIYM